MEAAAPAYPVGVTLPQERALNRWWGLLWFGMFVRYILAIPHFIVMAVLGIALYLGAIIVWIPILIYGRVPALWIKLAGELINRGTRVGAYGALFPGSYPALGMGESGPVAVRIDVVDPAINRLWGIPLFGMLARFIVLIPHFIILYALSFVAGLVTLVVWIPILRDGRYPDLGMRLQGIYLQYSARVFAYAALLPVPYPPFDFSI
jgi:hypothetical protein